MVAEDVVERPRAALPYGGRLALTLLLLGLYFLGHRVSLPFVEADGLRETLPYLRFDLLMLRARPLVTGFLLVELFALLTSTGRRLRRDGAAGRGRLNRAALGISLALAALQACGVALSFQRMSTPMVVVSRPGPGFVLILTATLTAVTAGLFVLGNLISKYGIGNGFALLVLMDMAMGNLNRLPSLEEARSPEWAAGLVLIAALAVLLVRWFQKTEPTFTAPFPQGVLPLGLVTSFLALSFLPRLQGWLTPEGGSAAVAAAAVFYGLVFCGLSWLGFLLFSRRRRIAAELPETDEVLDQLAAELRRRLLPATLLLAGGVMAFSVWRHFLVESTGSPSFWMGELVAAVAILFDVVDQYRFSRRNPDMVQLAQLDDVHFTLRLAERLAEEGIDALARNHRFRSLYFFLGPLYKMDLLVPAENLEFARQVMAELESTRELKVF